MGVTNPADRNFPNEGGDSAYTLLRPGRYLVGRAPKCEIVVQHPTVSRSHAIIQVAKHTICVRDLRSRNGTLVNDVRIDEKLVHPGDRVTFGKVEFHICDNPLALASFTSCSDESTASVRRDYVSQLIQGSPLTPAPRRVLACLVQGLSEKEIGTKLNLSVHTVHNHVRTIYECFNVNSRSELLARYVNAGKAFQSEGDIAQ